MTERPHNLNNVLELGEGQFIEFKELFDKSLAKEMSAFANASGGVIYLGINDDGLIKEVRITNRLKSAIQDIAHNCDPPVIINLNEINNVLAIEVREGDNKPYSCSSGFLCAWVLIPRRCAGMKYWPCPSSQEK